MPSELRGFLTLAFSLTAAAILLASPLRAQSKTELAEACIQAVEAGDLQTASELASQIMEWKNLFNTTTIKAAEQCLQSATGEFWKYFSTKSRFLSGTEANAEQSYIDGADDRKAKRVESLQRKKCEVMVAESELSNLEAEYETIKEARDLELLSASFSACTKLYQQDQETALLNPICFDVFRNSGLPDTKILFDNSKLETARINLALSKIALWQEVNSNGNFNTAKTAQLKECQELLSE